MVSSPALSSAACGSSPLSRSCQLSSEPEPLDRGRDDGLPATFAAASLAFVSEQVMLSTLITAHSEGADSFCVQSAMGEAVEGVALLAGDGVSTLLEEAAEDRAIPVVSASEGVVGGV